jgi:beta-galactosidase
LREKRFFLGACYYPEHWPESLWEDDFRRMREMGFSVVRMAEFAWTIFEPEEGRFDFSFFDRVMDLTHKHEIKVILGTPTATPPAWLTYKYPEVLNHRRDGVSFTHGRRRHYNYNAPIYRELCTRIADKMAAHYHNHPALLGWQIDNELNCEVDVFYSPTDQVAFREWLRQKYGSLDQLNEAWGAVFWNITYTDWEQVTLAGPTPSDGPNPHQALDEKRFFSDSAIFFAKLQAEAIRKHDKTHFITTNGIFGHLDNNKLTREVLDFISYDSYPLSASLWAEQSEHPLRDRRISASLSIVASFSPEFAVMEQQSGPGASVNWNEVPSPKPGQMRLWTYQSIAHGADMVLYFRWRTASFGTEIYWHGINDYHNQPNRRCAEAAQVGKELAQIGDKLIGSTYQADVALIKDYDNEWDGELDIWHGPFERRSADAWYRTLQYRHVPTDILYLQPNTSVEKLSRYRCLIYPHPTILPEETAGLLKEYVAQGGTVIFGCRTGYKDSRGHCPMRPMPGLVADLCGVSVEDFTRVTPSSETSVNWKGVAEKLPSGQFNDILRVESSSARVLAVYGEEAAYYAGKPALVENPWGKGRAIYFGGVFTDLMASALADYIELKSPLADIITLPTDVELAIRQHAEGAPYIFLLNYADTPQTVQLSKPLENLLTGEKVQVSYAIPPYDLLILQG